MKRLLAIGIVWLGCSIAWMILGATLFVRSGESSSALENEVHALWGPPIQQLPPRATLSADEPKPLKPVAVPQRADWEEDSRYAAPAPPDKPPTPETMVPLVGSEIDVALGLEHRKKGLIWFPTYSIDFHARYSFENPSDESKSVAFSLPLEQEHALYDGFEVSRDSGDAIAAEVVTGVARWKETLGPHEKRSYDVRYRSRGTSRWQYDLTSGTGRVQNFRMTLATDFSEVDFLPGTISPSTQQRSAGKWSGTWQFKTLVASSPIGLDLPQRLNPGPLASRITFFAPVSLLFFFFVTAILATARQKRLHPLHYFFFGCAFFAFHLLFSYLVDHFAIFPSFAISSLVSIGLVVSYARLFVGWKFAAREMGIAQLIYLVLFSFSFFWTGFTGLAVTIGAILTLFVLMQIMGRRDPSQPEAIAAHGCATPYRCAAVVERE